MQPELVTDAPRTLTDRLRGLAERLHIPPTLTKFLIVGGIGYLINQGVLFLGYDTSVLWFLPDKDTSVNFGLFTHPDIRLLIAGVIAVEVSIIAQFHLHERWTFRNRVRTGNGLLRFLKFNASAIVSPVVSVGTTNVLTPVFDISYLIANTIGVLLGFIWNWTLNSLVIWPHRREEG